MLMRAVLVEQIYRIESIISSHPYHKIWFYGQLIQNFQILNFSPIYL
jgi:hypothetical protein